LAKNVLKTEETNTTFLFAPDHQGNTFWHVAAKHRDFRVIIGQAREKNNMGVKRYIL
jgi:hypothetical protein